MGVLNWQTLESGVELAGYGSQIYRVSGNIVGGTHGYTACRFPSPGRDNFPDRAVWFFDESNKAPTTEVAKAACERDASAPEGEEEVVRLGPGLREIEFGPAQQAWVTRIPVMQQSVLFAAIRAPDGLRKNHPVKVLMRWYRRCVLLSAFDKRALLNPLEAGGGSFTGPFTKRHCFEVFGCTPGEEDELRAYFDRTREVYLEHVDEFPHHFQLHFMHAAQIVGVHHEEEWIRDWWKQFYLMIVDDAHLQPESDAEMNLRLSDDCDAWKAREVVTAK